MTKEDAWSLARHWVAAWNAQDLELIMTHYEDAIELTSPVAAQLGTPDGKVVGKANLRAYFQRGLAAYPELHFQLEDVLWGLNSVVLYYINQRGNACGGVHGVGGDGKNRKSCGELQWVARAAAKSTACGFAPSRIGSRVGEGSSPTRTK